MDERGEVPDRVHDQPAEGGREQAEEALRRQQQNGRRTAEDQDVPPRPGLESGPVDEAAGRPGGAGQ